jgi:hypothetical protein
MRYVNVYVGMQLVQQSMKLGSNAGNINFINIESLETINLTQVSEWGHEIMSISLKMNKFK